MAVQLSVEARNARLDSVETVLGASGVLRVFSGAQPANCAAANSGTELLTITLPADSFAAAGSGAKAKSGTWSSTGLAGAGAGTDAGHFRIYKSDGTTCVMQGTVGEGSGDLSLDNSNIAVGQTVTVTTFTLNDANS